MTETKAFYIDDVEREAAIAAPRTLEQLFAYQRSVCDRMKAGVDNWPTDWREMIRRSRRQNRLCELSEAILGRISREIAAGGPPIGAPVTAGERPGGPSGPGIREVATTGHTEGRRG